MKCARFYRPVGTANRG